MFQHHALIYDAEDDFLATAVPFLDEGASLGETAILGTEPQLSAAVLDAVQDPAAVKVVEDCYESPLTTLRANHELFSGAVERMRIVGQIPSADLRTEWRGWARYEAAANDVFAPFPVSALCAYDTRTTADAVLEDVLLTHPGTASPHGSRHNDEYVEPAAFLTLLAEGEVDPLERTEPRFVIHDPQPAHARHAVAALARLAGAGSVESENVALATDEVVTNAIKYGSPPVRVAAWAGDGRVVVAVSDRGTGPDDPYAGLLPDRTPGVSGGLGLHIAYQVCDVALTYSATAFTVHLVSRGDRA